MAFKLSSSLAAAVIVHNSLALFGKAQDASVADPIAAAADAYEESAAAAID